MAMMDRRSMVALAVVAAGQVMAQLDTSAATRNLLIITQFQLDTAELALKRDVRPEIRSLAEETRALQINHASALRSLAPSGGALRLPLELQAIIDGLAPLDGLEFSRRYAEVQEQALGQEVLLRRSGAAAGTGGQLEATPIAALESLQAKFRTARSALSR